MFIKFHDAEWISCCKKAGNYFAMVMLLATSFYAVLPTSVLAKQHDLLEMAEALRTYQLGNPEEARPILERLSKDDHYHASYALGTMYWEGDGVEADHGHAQKYFEKAADQGSLYAALAMTTVCTSSSTSRNDHRCAERWLGRAKKIETERYINLVVTQDKLHRPIPPIPRSSVVGEWLKESENSGHSPIAEYFLGLLYETGYSPNIEINRKKSTELIVSAGNSGLAIAQTYVGELLAAGHYYDENPKKAIEWYEAAAKQGFQPAKARVGTMLVAWPEGVELDVDRGLQLLKEAADERVVMAAYDLGFLYAHGKGVDRNLALASKWLRKAADLGSVAAHGLLGLLYYDGKGVARDYGRAKYHLQHAARDDFARAQLVLSDLLLTKLDGSHDKSKGYAWLHFASDGKPLKMPQDLREWVNKLKEIVSNDLSDADKRDGQELIKKRENGLSYVRTRTSWCVRINGTLCSF